MVTVEAYGPLPWVVVTKAYAHTPGLMVMVGVSGLVVLVAVQNWSIEIDATTVAEAASVPAPSNPLDRLPLPLNGAATGVPVSAVSVPAPPNPLDRLPPPLN